VGSEYILRLDDAAGGGLTSTSGSEPGKSGSSSKCAHSPPAGAQVETGHVAALGSPVAVSGWTPHNPLGRSASPDEAQSCAHGSARSHGSSPAPAAAPGEDASPPTVHQGGWRLFAPTGAATDAVHPENSASDLALLDDSVPAGSDLTPAPFPLPAARQVVVLPALPGSAVGSSLQLQSAALPALPPSSADTPRVPTARRPPSARTAVQLPALPLPLATSSRRGVGTGSVPKTGTSAALPLPHGEGEDSKAGADPAPARPQRRPHLQLHIPDAAPAHGPLSPVQHITSPLAGRRVTPLTCWPCDGACPPAEGPEADAFRAAVAAAHGPALAAESAPLGGAAGCRRVGGHGRGGRRAASVVLPRPVPAGRDGAAHAGGVAGAAGGVDGVLCAGGIRRDGILLGQYLRPKSALPLR